jgi:predicted DNA-binding ribbon-helix-helix protein
MPRKPYKVNRVKPRALTIDDPTWQKVQELAEMRGCSKSELIRQLLLKELPKFSKQRANKEVFLYE